MSYSEDVMKEIQNEMQAPEPVAAPAPAPATEPAPAPEPAEAPQPVEAPQPAAATEPAPAPEPAPVPGEEPQPQPQQTEPQPKPAKPDFSSLTKEQKAEHAFQRQLARQKEKYENSIKELTGNFQKQIDELKTTINKKPPEPLKTRDQFDTDDEFIRYLTDRGVDEKMARIREEDEKKAAEQARVAQEDAQRQQALAEQADSFRAHCDECFTDPEQRSAFEVQLTKATKNGLADVLDQAPAVREFVFVDPDGPRVLDAMLKDKTTFMRVMSRAGNPMAAVIEMHDLARELRQPQQAQQQLPENVIPMSQQPQQQPASPMPHLGKPGAGSGGTQAPSIWNSDDDLIAFCRKGRHV